MTELIASPTIDYTHEQDRAIGSREKSIALAAGAGCGKTFVLTERFLAELEPTPDRDPERRLGELVAITFTDAAARQLRSRIRQLVRDRMSTTELDEQDYWRHLYRALDACRVSTIHSLCGQLLRSHAFDVGLDPLFSILDQSSSLVLRADAIEDTLRHELAVRDPETFDLASVWGIEGLKQRIAGLIDEHRSEAFAQWLEQEPGDAVADWNRFYCESVWPNACRELAREADPLIGLLGEYAPQNTDAAGTKLELLNLLTILSDGEPTQGDLAAIRKLAKVQSGAFTRGKWGDAELYSHFKDSAKILRDAIDKLPSADFTTASAQRSAELGLSLAHLTQRAAIAYSRSKDAIGALDYDDLLARAHHLLTDESHHDAQEQIRDQIRLLMVDEFQDTDHLQVEIVRALSGDVRESGKLFFVGDDKQSIYRFRGAEPQVFVDLRGDVDEEWRLPLSINFRSQPAILHFVNALFENVFTGTYQQLTPNRRQFTPEPAIEFLWTPVEGQSSGKGSAGWMEKCRRAEARSIASRLREMFDGEETIVADRDAPRSCRPAKPGDVAICFACSVTCSITKRR
ncbi:MAG: UvrD-helicase domain-containing protein [Aeoliella sp.]